MSFSCGGSLKSHNVKDIEQVKTLFTVAATFNPGYRNAHDLAYPAYCISEVRLPLVPPRKFVLPAHRFDCRKLIYTSFVRKVLRMSL
jgi:hypothetical protein